MKTRFTQAGSTLSFVLVGVALIVITGSVFYFVSRNMDDGDVAVDTPEVTLPSESDKSDNSAKKQDDTSSDKTSDKSTDTTTDTDTSTTETDGTTETQDDVDRISQTGPADTFAQIVAVGGLSLAVVAYIRSRKSRLPL